jgi:membrane-associated phospholipid phosphatase
MVGAAGAFVHQLQAGDIVLWAATLLLVSSALCSIATRLWESGWKGRLAGYAEFAWQIGVVLALEQAYEFTRGRITAGTPDVALLHAYRVLDLEWRHGFFVEQRLERFFLQFGFIMNAIDLFYVFAHLIASIGVLVWVYVRRRQSYPFVRNLMMLTTAIALVAFYVYPTAPPRMLGNYGFVDPLQLHHLVGAGGAQPNSFTYNPYAAMPSLHVGYALIVGVGVWLADRRVWARVLACLYPLTMSAAVVISGNHWILDVIGAFITVSIAAGTLLACGWCTARLRPRVSMRSLTHGGSGA